MLKLEFLSLVCHVYVTMTIYQSICQAVRVYGINPSDLAKLTGLPRQTTTRYLSGQMDLSGKRLDLILNALDIKLVRYTTRTTKRQARLLWISRLKKRADRSLSGLTLFRTELGERWMTDAEIAKWREEETSKRSRREAERLARKKRAAATRKPKAWQAEHAAAKRSGDNDIFD